MKVSVSDCSEICGVLAPYDVVGSIGRNEPDLSAPRDGTRFERRRLGSAMNAKPEQ